MKKIIGILAAAATLTASVFAADVSATVGVKSSLFKYDSAKTITLLGQLDNVEDLFKLEFSSDKAGAGIKYIGSATGAVKFKEFKVWFKPMDNLKLSFRENGLGLFGPTTGEKYLDGFAGGYGVEYMADALTINVTLQDNFLVKVDGIDAVIQDLGAKVGYKADFGEIAVLAGAKTNFKKFSAGAGYKGKFGDIEFIADAQGVFDNTGAKMGITLNADVSAKGSADALSWAVAVPVQFVVDPSSVAVGAAAEAKYTIDTVSLKAYFVSLNLMKLSSDPKAKVGLDVEGKVGAASWKIAPSYELAKKEFNVGFESKINF